MTVQTLVEEHASGKVLLRVGERVRLTPIGVATALLASMAAVAPLLVPVGILGLVALAIVLVLGARRFGQLVRVESGLQQEIERVAGEFRLLPVLARKDGAYASQAPTAQQPIDAKVAALGEQGIGP